MPHAINSEDDVACGDDDALDLADHEHVDCVECHKALAACVCGLCVARRLRAAWIEST